MAESVKRTGKALVVYEDNRSFGYGAEIAAWIADQVFEWLDAPVRRVAALDCAVAYAPNLEDEILPQSEHVLAAIHELAAKVSTAELADAWTKAFGHPAIWLATLPKSAFPAATPFVRDTPFGRVAVGTPKDDV